MEENRNVFAKLADVPDDKITLWDQESYKFVCFDSVHELFIFMKRIKNTPAATFHEVIRSTKPQKLRFDIDLPGAKKTEGIKLLQDLLHAVLNYYHEREILLDLPLILISNSEEKFSAHIIYNITHDLTTLKNNVNQILSKINAEGIDTEIYKSNQNFRLLWNTKPGQNRYLEPLEFGLYNELCEVKSGDELDEELFRSSLIQDYGSKSIFSYNKSDYNCAEMTQELQERLDKIPEMNNHIVREITEINDILFATTYRTAPSFCDMCEKVHERDNTLMLKITPQTIKYKCMRKTENGYVSFPATDDVVKSIVPINPDDEPDAEILNQRYLDIKIKPGITIVKSSMNTGKTTFLTKISKEFERILIVTNRVSMSNYMMEKYEGFTHYTDADFKKANKIVIQVDSLVKLRGVEFDLLILDEFNSTMNYVYSCPPGIVFKNNLYNTLTELTHKIKNSKYVFACEHDFSKYNLDMLFNLNLETKMYINNYKPFENFKIQTINGNVKSKHMIWKKMIDSISAAMSENKKVCIVTDSKRKAKIVDTVFDVETDDYLGGISAKFADKKVLYMHGDNKSEHKSIKEWSNYDIVIFTPTITTGQSFDEVYFDHVFAVVTGFSVEANDIMQMMFRIRDAPNRTIVNMTTRYEEQVIDYKLIYNRMLEFSMFNDYFIRYLAIRNGSYGCKTYYKLISLIREMGIEIQHHNVMPHSDEKINKMLANSFNQYKKDVREMENEAVREDDYKSELIEKMLRTNEVNVKSYEDASRAKIIYKAFTCDLEFEITRDTGHFDTKRYYQAMLHLIKCCRAANVYLEHLTVITNETLLKIVEQLKINKEDTIKYFSTKTHGAFNLDSSRVESALFTRLQGMFGGAFKPEKQNSKKKITKRAVPGIKYYYKLFHIEGDCVCEQCKIDKYFDC